MFCQIIQMLLVSLICHTLIVIRGQHVNSSPFSRWNQRDNRRWRVRFDAIGVSAHPMAVFSGFNESHEPPPSGDARGIVPPHRPGHRNGHQSGYMLHQCYVDCCPGGCRGNTEWLVDRWRLPVASYVTLVMLHQVMPHVSLQCLRMAIEMASDGGAFVRCRRLFCLA